MTARFLHFYPQYSLADLCGPGLSMEEFAYLYGGMVDVLNPDATTSFEEKAAEATMRAHLKATRRS